MIFSLTITEKAKSFPAPLPTQIMGSIIIHKGGMKRPQQISWLPKITFTDFIQTNSRNKVNSWTGKHKETKSQDKSLPS